jgi:hypothetical protein
MKTVWYRYAGCLAVVIATCMPVSAKPIARSSAPTPKQIAAHNEGLSPEEPEYMRCRKEEVIGSWAKKVRVCRTNREWSQRSDTGNQNARDTIEAMTRAPASGNQ